MRKIGVGIALLAILLVTVFAMSQQRNVLAQGAGDDEPKGKLENPFPRRVKAPPLDGGTAWLNSAGPIELSKLKGKVVLLDFWTYCCINCMHILPDLARLEKEFPNELVVIGVHSAKFTGEQVTENIRDAIMRNEIAHPVVNDANMKIWRSFGVNAWPTQLLIDPEGFFVGGASGEGNYEVFRGAIKKLIAYHEQEGTLDRTPLHFELERYGQSNTPLRYPGKILVDGDRLFIADSGHHRVVVAHRTDGSLIRVIGTGEAGYVDGPAESAQFFEPQGLALRGQTLYVCDRKNHLLRAIDLETGAVSTIAGTGKQGFERERTGPAREVPLASPWDILLLGDELIIAMAGTHQIWKLDLTTNQVGPYAGSGRENISNGDPASATFAQPSGLSADDHFIYVADSETSSIRKIRRDNQEVETVVGQGLFEFGDVDGVGDVVRLQHALAVIHRAGTLYVADTYNNKIKTIDLKAGRVETYLGGREAGSTDDPPLFDEPAGLSLAGDTLYVADTNNHAIRVIDLNTNKVSTLTVGGLAAPAEPTDDGQDSVDESVRAVDAVTLAAGKPFSIEAAVSVADDQKLNPVAPMSYRLFKKSTGGEMVEIKRGRVEPPAAEFQIDVAEVDLGDAEGLELAVTYFPCDQSSQGVCRIARTRWTIPVTLSEVGESAIKLAP